MDKYYKLSKKTFIILVTIIGILLLLNNLLIRSHLSNLRKKVINLKQNSLENVSKNHISKEIGDGERIFDYLYNWTIKEGISIKSAENYQEKWDELLSLSKEVSYIYIGMDTGEIYVSPHYEIAKEFIVKDRPWYRNAIDNPNKKNWLIYRDYNTGIAFLSVSKAFHLKNGKTGVLGLDVSKEQISNYLSHVIKDSKSEEIFLVNGQDYIREKSLGPKIDSNILWNAFNKISGKDKGYFIQDDWYIFYTSIHLEGWKLINFVKIEDLEQELTSYKKLSDIFNIFQLSIMIIGLLFAFYKISLLWGKDSLTGLLNRGVFNNHLNNLDKKPCNYSIIFIDIDDFKLINDVYGHQVGDVVLNRLGKLLSARINPSDRAYRYGGEEFVVYSSRSIREISALGEEIRQEVESLSWREGFTVTVSLGISFSNGNPSCYVVKKADDLLYKSKKEGKNRISMES